MWTYRQRGPSGQGELLLDGSFKAYGYSGYDDGDGIPEPGEGKNDPSKQTERGIGPIPVGLYRIGTPHRHPTAGPFTMRLTPMPETNTFGRSGFLIHGDSRKNPGAGSHGCIVLLRPVREAIWKSGDVLLEVVTGEPSKGDGNEYGDSE